MISQEDIEKDVDLIIWSMGLCGVLRYQRQTFWEQETANCEAALAIDGRNANGDAIPRAESVADHSWHMADMALLIGPRFPELDLGRCAMLAVLHDKLEILTGDFNPLGQDGTGAKTYAFDAEQKKIKQATEKDALVSYLKKVSAPATLLQQGLLTDMLELNSIESKFVKALDRLQVFSHVLQRKRGVMEDGNIAFMLRYLSGCKTYFPPIAPYYDCFVARLLKSVAGARGLPVVALEERFQILLQAA